jgi:hypothetical protein
MPVSFSGSGSGGSGPIAEVTAAEWAALTPADGDLAYVTDHGIAYQYDGTFWNVWGTPDPARAYYYRTDFDDPAATSGGWQPLQSGTGAASAIQTIADQNANGAYLVAPGTDATGRASMYKSDRSVRLGGSVGYVRMRVKLTALPITATNDAIYQFGLGDATTTGDHTDGVSIVYDNAGSDHFWLGRNSKGGARTTVTSAIAPTTSWTTLRIEFTETTSTFYADGVAFGAALATNFPTGASEICGPLTKVIKSLGAANLSYQLDYFEFFQRYTTRR